MMEGINNKIKAYGYRDIKYLKQKYYSLRFLLDKVILV
jgi:transposase